MDVRGVLWVVGVVAGAAVLLGLLLVAVRWLGIPAWAASRPWAMVADRNENVRGPGWGVSSGTTRGAPPGAEWYSSRATAGDTTPLTRTLVFSLRVPKVTGASVPYAARNPTRYLRNRRLP
ncbi:hypothetical protein ABT346_09295 [Micromonospora peucetia]|uniref:hypothetical protein n=1 Tax=Micromonospora peucetia TaxID=47871 RepID=UPI00331ECADE